MAAQDPACAVELVRRDRQPVSMWSGGTTTEIAIYPKEAVYSRRDFLWRISSAHVDSAESEFTSLPGIWRLIMVLEGDMTLEHEHHHSVRLQPFQQDAFAGDWATRSKGKARDFNIMLTAGCTAQMRAASVQRDPVLAVPVETDQACDTGKNAAFIVYSVDGELTAETIDHGTWRIDAGDALLLTTGQPGIARSVQLSSLGDTAVHVVLATIQY